MAYEIVMPQLSDSMEEGKLISWKVKEKQSVKKGDVIAEVESDKAIMEVQSFKDGIVEEIKVKEGESVPVGTVIAVIDTTSKETKPDAKTLPPKSKEKKKDETKQETFFDEIIKNSKENENKNLESSLKTAKADASPKAKAVAARYGVDIQELQKKGIIDIPAHEDDIKEYHLKKYFTPKALNLLKQYRLDPSIFSEDKKHDTEDILSYIKTHNIALAKKIEPFQKTLIKSVMEAAKKPSFHIYDYINAALLKNKKEYSLSVWLIVLFAKAIMKHKEFRSILKEDMIETYQNASISLAIAQGKYLYMPVLKNIDQLTPAQINDRLKDFEQKAKNRTFSLKEFEGSTFGISNLGMTGIYRFDAMINKNDNAIAAIGALDNEKISITLTIDHRVINGYQAAEFMQTLKELSLNPQTFKE